MYRLIGQGIVPAVRVGVNGSGPIRVPSRELEAWLFSEEAA